MKIGARLCYSSEAVCSHCDCLLSRCFPMAPVSGLVLESQEWRVLLCKSCELPRTKPGSGLTYPQPSFVIKGRLGTSQCATACKGRSPLSLCKSVLSPG